MVTATRVKEERSAASIALGLCLFCAIANVE